MDILKIALPIVCAFIFYTSAKADRKPTMVAVIMSLAAWFATPALWKEGILYQIIVQVILFMSSYFIWGFFGMFSKKK